MFLQKFFERPNVKISMKIDINELIILMID